MVPLLIDSAEVLTFLRVVEQARELEHKWKNFVVYGYTPIGQVVWIHVDELRWAVFIGDEKEFEEFCKYVEDETEAIVRVRLIWEVKRKNKNALLVDVVG